MSIKRLIIDQQPGAIGIRNTPAKMNISIPKSQISIKNERSQLQIDRKAPSFKVNQKKIRNESGLKDPAELSRIFRNKGRQAALRGARQNTEDGNFLANPKIPGDKSVPRLAKNKAMSRLQKPEINVGLMPQSAPEITWEKGYMRLNWSKHSVVIDWNGEYLPEMTVDPQYSVEVFMRTKPYFRVMVEEALDTPGRYVDRAI